MKQNRHLYITALAALLALLAGSSLLEQSMAMPLARDVAPKDLLPDFGLLSPAQAAAPVDHLVQLQKRQRDPTGEPNPRPTTNPPNPQPTNPRPQPPQTQDPAPPRTQPPRPPATTTRPRDPPAPTTPPRGSNSSASSHSGGAVTATVPPSPSSTTPGPKDDDTLPTDVSNKVWIGLGTVGGIIVFALGGIAFCRHRKKKNLATALLQQTAQFNNNNPYAKLSEPSTPVKENLPMTPTKPLGTFNVLATYTPVLADEIEIRIGDSVTILQEYDDGWCMGVNNSRGNIKGVFPRHCLEMPYNPAFDNNGGGYGGPGGFAPPQPNFDAPNKRMSSIPGWGGAGPGQYHGGGNFPPQGPGYNGGGGGGPGYYNGY
ncbi:hypothetical protein BGZ73_006971 [Actinomortierella ambigua]|nr:hypothetical protein BGZ73_006971 [Actinomortierella ambigua]